jgi:hypothetical protein
MYKRHQHTPAHRVQRSHGLQRSRVNINTPPHSVQTSPAQTSTSRSKVTCLRRSPCSAPAHPPQAQPDNQSRMVQNIMSGRKIGFQGYTHMQALSTEYPTGLLWQTNSEATSFVRKRLSSLSCCSVFVPFVQVVLLSVPGCR